MSEFMNVSSSNPEHPLLSVQPSIAMGHRLGAGIVVRNTFYDVSVIREPLRRVASEGDLRSKSAGVTQEEYLTFIDQQVRPPSVGSSQDKDSGFGEDSEDSMDSRIHEKNSRTDEYKLPKDMRNFGPPGYFNQEKLNHENPQCANSAIPVSSFPAGPPGKFAALQSAATLDNAKQLAYQLQKSKPISERIKAAFSLGRIAGFDKMPLDVREVISDSLSKALIDRHLKVRVAAACALGNLGESAVTHLDALAALFSDSHDEARAAAAFSVGKVAGGTANAAKYAFALSALLQDKHCKVRGAAATSIGVIGLSEPHLVKALAAALTDKDANVRAQAAYALGKLGDADMPHEVATSLVFMLRDESIKVQESALHTLGKCSTAAKPFILILVLHLRDGQPSIRAAAANALGNLGEEAKPVAASLAAVLTDANAEVRAATAFALGKLDDAATPYIAALEELQQNDARAKVRKAAMCALQKLGATTFDVHGTGCA